MASCSYDGATELAFVTPASALLEIEVPERITNENDGGLTVSLRELAARDQIILG